MASVRRRVAIVVVVSVFAGCGGGGGDGGGLGESDTGGGDTGGAGDSIEVTTPLQAIYSHVADSSGFTTAEGVEVLLLFEPSDQALLYVASDEEAIAYHGSWTYRDDQMSLRFSGEDFQPDVTFGLDLSEDEVEMPFQAFSTEQGTSTWHRREMPLDSAIYAVFNGAAVDEVLNPTPEQALDRAYEYAKAVIAAGAGGGDSETSLSGGVRLISHNRQAAPAQANPDGLVDVVKHADGLELFYADRPPVRVGLFSYGPAPANPVPLSPGPLASDPRVHLEVETPGDASDDPPNKTALFFAGLVRYRSMLSFFSEDPEDTGAETVDLPMDKIDAAASKLEDEGYTVTKFYSKLATVKNLIKGLGTGTAPGFVFIGGHGGYDGLVMTGEYVGDTFCEFKDPKGACLKSVNKDVKNRSGEALEALKAEYPDLFAYKGKNEGATTKIQVITAGHGLKADSKSFYLAVKPLFWEWLRVKHGTDFGRSLVYIGACVTDSSPELREAIRARSYFAFKSLTYAPVLGGVLQYLTESLSRATRSAEEAYYNMIRVSNTRQIIFKEDKILEGMFTDSGSSGVFNKLIDSLDGWGWDGTKLVPYNGTGWLDPAHVDGGDVWWMVFAGRWGPNADGGANKLEECWNLFWSQGNRGGLASPACNASNAGDVPKQDEVAYATYLLGNPKLAYSGTLVPRFTLADGG